MKLGFLFYRDSQLRVLRRDLELGLLNTAETTKTMRTLGDAL
jgi:hypothetical protein